MKSGLIAAGQALAVGAAVLSRSTSTSQQLCAGKSFQENGNWYCQPVNRITYNNVGSSGEYQEVVSMNQETGECEFRPRKFSGPLAPFNEPMSLHFRGPLHLKQVAVYMPSGSQTKQEVKRNDTPKRDHHHGHRHNHQRLHRHHHNHRSVKKRACDPITWVTATINGQVASWINDYCPDQTQAPTAPTSTSPISVPAEPTSSPQPTIPPVNSNNNPTDGDDDSGDELNEPPASYTRISHYHAATSTSQNLTFLANLGGPLSGRWTPTFGNTLSYLSSSGSSGSSHPSILSDTLLPSTAEAILLSSTPCTESTCGYTQPGSVAYTGFGGPDKIFLVDFAMPHAPGDDMPAIWMLNAKIPYTSQYGACSCWKSGCGEFDVFEVLEKGGTKAKSTFHSVKGGGDSNYFVRPGGVVRLAVVFDAAAGTVAVKLLGGLGQDKTGAEKMGMGAMGMGGEIMGEVLMRSEVEGWHGGGSGSEFAIAP
ncbi:hypothetical protein OQA88_1576 [Cercophora sp. LCS_1]